MPMKSHEIPEELEKLDAIDKIPMMDFLSKVTDIFLLVNRTLELLERDEERTVMEYLTKSKEALKKLGIFDEASIGPPQDKERLEEEAFAILEASFRKKLENSQLILVNQTLVMLCTIFEIFLNVSLEIVLKRKPEILLSTAHEKIITFKDLVELGDYDSILNSFRDKVTHKFSREEIEDRILFYDKHLGIKTTAIFDWQIYIDEIHELLKGWNLEKLKEVFGKRHDIVHRNELPISNLEEVATIVEFMSKIIMNISGLLQDKFKIPIDMKYILYRMLIIQGKMTVEQFCEAYDIQLD